VSFSFPDAFESVTVTRNDEPYNYVMGGSISEGGAYSMRFDSDSINAAIAPIKPYFSFRIIDGPTADMDIYNAPRGYAIMRATLDGRELYAPSGVLIMRADGLYEIEVSADYAGGRTQEVVILRDTAPPEFRLNGVEEGLPAKTDVTVEYLADDVDSVHLFSEGEEIYFADGAISLPGRYRLDVYDTAGNLASAEFEVAYRLNRASALLIAAGALLLVLGVVGVMVRGRRNLRTR
jgi:hypothetical protein